MSTLLSLKLLISIDTPNTMNLLQFVGMTSETSVAICSMIFGGVLEKCPNLKVCFAHGGTWITFWPINGSSMPNAIFFCRSFLLRIELFIILSVSLELQKVLSKL